MPVIHELKCEVCDRRADAVFPDPEWRCLVIPASNVFGDYEWPGPYKRLYFCREKHLIQYLTTKGTIDATHDTEQPKVRPA